MPSSDTQFKQGGARPKRQTKCRDCGTSLLRGAWWHQARCRDCSRRKFMKADHAQRRLRLQEARRYRILMALSPYDSWEELLEAVRVRQPKTRIERRDVTLERRANDD